MSGAGPPQAGQRPLGAGAQRLGGSSLLGGGRHELPQHGRELLDLNYLEDKDAEVDANIVMTGQGKFVEVQGSGEETTFTPEQLQALIALSQKGLKELAALQTAFLTKHLLSGSLGLAR